MMIFEPGKEIEIPCSLEPGAFMGEYFITIKLDCEEISGFVPKGFVSKTGESSGYISGTIEQVVGSTITIRIPGSFFTTTGVADISQQWAVTNAKVL